MEGVSGFNEWRINNTLKGVAKNPWENDAPHCYPYVTNSRNNIYNVLNCDDWKHFTNYQVIELFRVSCKEKFFKTRSWQQLYGSLCIESEQTIRTKTITQDGIKYVYECIYQMSSKEMDTFLKNLKILVLSVILHTKIQLSQMLPPSSPAVDQAPSRLLQSNKKSTTAAAVTNVSASVSTGIPNNEHHISTTFEQRNLYKRPHDQVSNLPKPQVTIEVENCAVSNVQSVTPAQQAIYQPSNSCASTSGENISKESCPHGVPKKRKLSLREALLFSTTKKSMTVGKQDSKTKSNQFAPFEINEMGDIVLYI